METQPSESEDQRNRTRRLQQICGLNGYVTYGVLEDHGIIDVISPLLDESEKSTIPITRNLPTVRSIKRLNGVSLSCGFTSKLNSAE
jgi:hypothetical protein